MKNSMIIMGVTVILVIFLFWGLIGSSKAAEAGIDCDVGIGDDGSVFCWKWHQNILGDIGEAIDDAWNN